MTSLDILEKAGAGAPARTPNGVRAPPIGNWLINLLVVHAAHEQLGQTVRGEGLLGYFFEFFGELFSRITRDA